MSVAELKARLEAAKNAFADANSVYVPLKTRVLALEAKITRQTRSKNVNIETRTELAQTRKQLADATGPRRIAEYEVGKLKAELAAAKKEAKAAKEAAKAAKKPDAKGGRSTRRRRMVKARTRKNRSL